MKPAPTPPTAEQDLARVTKTARLNGWSIVVIAGLGTLLSAAFGDWSGTLIGLLAVGAGAMEVHGQRRLGKRDAAGVTWMIRGELFLLAVIAVYAVSRLASFDREAVIANLTPDMRENLKAAGLELADIVPLVQKMFYVLYGTVLLVTLIYQGGMARYYQRKRPRVIEALTVQARPQAWVKPPPPPPSAPVYSLRRQETATDRPFFPQDIIARKRDGGQLTREEIVFFAKGVVDGSFADYQATALLMAIYWRGMTPEETAWLTDAMLRSGEIINLSDVPGHKVDKHSTGGVGDKVSLILSPLAAACGVRVPMMSGRGLGHTGGTLDKLEAIPGFRVNLGVPEFMLLVERIGCAMIGQTQHVAPADRKLYALRDVTGTVECIPLICASIMSKKLAEGINSLVLDVKFGKGAFMKTRERALELAEAMVAIGRVAGKPVRAQLTTMDQPLGRAVGHATEVVEAIECLKGRGPADLMEVTTVLTAHMLVQAGVAKDETDARKRVKATIASGLALKKFRDLCQAQSGDPRVVDDYGFLPSARLIRPLAAPADAAGYVAEVDALKIGQAVMALGGGRAAVTDKVDHAVGVSDLVKIGEAVTPGARLCMLHANDEARAAKAEALIREAIRFSATPPEVAPLVQDLVQ